ncbi:glycosyltransferase [Paenibacillus sp. GCM10023250]|uniref:glycosyltransferase n=1 Tax=Paenibacillus sp. GCM10023250 TaxID=3252648 RepID=UPI00361414C8
MKISVCLIVKNEEKQLERALSSIPSSFEIIVTDTGSTDRTVEIAKRYAEGVYAHEWQDDFADARNASIARATGDYILIMDADERLPDHAEIKLQEHVRRFPDRAATVGILNWSDKEPTRHRVVRFFPNHAGYRFGGKVHEQLYFAQDLAEAVHSELIIEHYGYLEAQYKSSDKFERYLRLYQSVLKEEPNDGYMLYQLGKLYYSSDRFAEAYEPLAACVSLEQYDRLYYPAMLVTLGYTLQRLTFSSQAIEMLEPFLELYPQYPDLPFLIGMLAMDTGDLGRIERYFKRALEIGETERYTTVPGTGSFRSAHNLGVFYELTGRLQEAAHFYGIGSQWGFEPSSSRLRQLSPKN